MVESVLSIAAAELPQRRRNGGRLIFMIDNHGKAGGQFRCWLHHSYHSLRFVNIAAAPFFTWKCSFDITMSH